MARLKEVVDDFKELLPLVQELGNPALQPRHWQDIFDIIGADIGPNDSGIGELLALLTLGGPVHLNLMLLILLMYAVW